MNHLIKRSSWIVLLILELSSCASLHTVTIEQNAATLNPYPAIMNIGKNESGATIHIIELIPTSLDLSCNLRNDSLYYWCTLSADLKNTSPQLPARIEATYHRAIDKKAVETSKRFIRQIRKDNVVYVVTPQGFTVNADAFSNLLFGIYSDAECMDLFFDYSQCPVDAKKIDIFSRDQKK